MPIGWNWKYDSSRWYNLGKRIIFTRLWYNYSSLLKRKSLIKDLYPTFWHQGAVSWKTGFPQTQGGVGGWFQNDVSVLHLCLPLTSCCAAWSLTGHRPLLICAPSGWGPLLYYIYIFNICILRVVRCVLFTWSSLQWYNAGSLFLFCRWKNQPTGGDLQDKSCWMIVDQGPPIFEFRSECCSTGISNS